MHLENIIQEKGNPQSTNSKDCIVLFSFLRAVSIISMCDLIFEDIFKAAKKYHQLWWSYVQAQNHEKSAKLEEVAIFFP